MNAFRAIFSTAALLICAPFAYAVDTPPSTATVTVDTTQSIAKVPDLGLGLGVAVWDSHMNDTVVPGLIRGAGFKVIRYPGGSYADIYHWKTNSATAGTGATVQQDDDFDHFMKLVQATDTQVLITVNYGSNADGTGGGDPAEAAAWVRYANVDHHYGVRYWEIGNEIYGNGEYTAKWEEDLHKDKSPSAYGNNVNDYVDAMKAVDKTIKIGAVLTAPDAWPDGVAPAWNPAVLAACGKKIDFVVVHWYPDQGLQSAILDATENNIPNIGKKARALVDKYCRPNTPIWITEGDFSGYTMRTEGALFAAELYPLIWENGIESFEWWDMHNGLGVADDGTYGDQGILSNGSCQGFLCEPAPNTPFQPYYGVELAHLLAAPGDTIVKCTSDTPSIAVHAARRADGSLGIMLINKDPKATYMVTVNAGVDLGASCTMYSFGPKSSDLDKGTAKTAGQSITVKLPPHTVSDVIAHG